MITHIPAEKRYHAKHGWLQTYHLFSFVNYYDPDNIAFGNLRVFNDDRIDAYSGFDEHGHESMEIVTIMLEGQLTHRDSMGNKKVLRAGEVQRMSAGNGVIHAEKNLDDEPVHLYQIWILPDQEGGEPSYEQKDFSHHIKKNELFPVVSSQRGGDTLRMQADASISLLELTSQKTLDYSLRSGYGLFVYVQEGIGKLNELMLKPGDQLRITEESRLSFSSEESMKSIFIEVKL